MTSPLPITSAPDDGRKVLVYDRMLGGWHAARWHDRDMALPGGWHIASTFLRLNPSHWMPLPPPPIEASDDTSGEGA